MKIPIPQFAAQVRAASDKRCPYVALVSADQPAAQTAVLRACDPDVALLAWSPILGLSAPAIEDGPNRRGQTALAGWLNGQDPAAFLGDQLLQATQAGPPECVLLIWGADRSMADPAMAGALLQLRDVIIASGVTIVGLCGSAITAGPLAGDVHVIRDTPPDDAERANIIVRLANDNDVRCEDDTIRVAANVTRGLTRFGVSQATALAINVGRLDIDLLSARMRETLGSLPGVTVLRPVREDSFGGSAPWIDYLRGYERANVSLIVQLDELEKVAPSAEGARDGGASAAIQGALLAHLNDSEPAGAIAEGVPGTGKTLSALVAAGIFGCPVIRINPAKMKGGIVGESETNAARVFAVLEAFGGLQFWIGTSNKLSTVPEELSDRFPDGVWFFDLPTAVEMPAIWRANLARYGHDVRLAENLAATSEGWTGRDCRAVCLSATRTGRSVLDVAREKIPAGRRMGRRIGTMREEARTEGYRSAATGSAYAGPAVIVAPTARGARKAAPATPAIDAGEETF